MRPVDDNSCRNAAMMSSCRVPVEAGVGAGKGVVWMVWMVGVGWEGWVEWEGWEDVEGVEGWGGYWRSRAI